MFQRIVAYSLRNRGLVLIATLLLVVAGLWAVANLKLGAVPDVTNNQVQINTEVTGMAPVEVEKLVTFPIEATLSGLPGVVEVRSLSKYGLSQVTVVFEDDFDLYLARQLVGQRLQAAREELPEQLGLNPEMAPISTGLGEIFQYSVRRDPSVPPADMIRNVQRHVPGFDPGRPDDPESLEQAELMALRSVQDWIIRYQLLGVPGVTEVNAFGGHVRQYQIWLDPERLLAHDLTVTDVFEAVEANNANAGGQYIERGGEYALIRGVGLVQSVEDIEDIVIFAEAGTPIHVRDVGRVVFAGEVRAGAATQDGDGEVVLGVVMMLKGANARTTVQAVKARLKEGRKSLPPGVVIDPFYDRQELVDRTVHTAIKNLAEGGLLVIIVLYLALGSLRGSLITALIIPLAMLFAVICMVAGNISGNLMSLGAIDFGILLDGGVVMVENGLRMLHQRGDKNRLETIRLASLEVARPVAFGGIIILIVYVPILSLQGVEGRLFKPLAFTVIFALLGALLLSLTTIPALNSFFLKADQRRGRKPEEAAEEEDTRLVAWIRRRYEPALEIALGNPLPVVAIAIGVFVGSVFVCQSLGSVFIPKLDEGAIALQVIRLPSTSLTQSIEHELMVERVLREFPEVETVASKTGRAEIATDPMGPEISDVYVILRPAEEWTTGRSKAELVVAMEAALERIPGTKVGFSQPIELRVNELISGVRSDIAVKVFGSEFDTLNRLAAEIEGILAGVPGAANVQTEQTEGLPVLNITINRRALARYGLNARDVNDLIEIGIGGGEAGEVLEGDARYALVVRLEPRTRSSAAAIGDLILHAPDGQRVRLRDIATIDQVEGPAQISRENASRRKVIEANVRGRDVGSFVAEAQRRIDAEVDLPPGYWLDWGGQFENLQRARRRLAIVVPVALLLILSLLYMTFGSLRDALLIFTNVPFAVSGGILALWVRGLPFSISAGVGFIVLAGIAVRNGVVMIAYFKTLREEGLPVDTAVRRGASIRLRPILMTALADIVGFLPMAVSRSAGAEVQRPLATVVIGGLVTATLLTLLVLPVIYRRFAGDVVEVEV